MRTAGRTSTSAPTVYRHLLRHQWCRTVRTLRDRKRRAMYGVVAFLGLYMGFTLVTLGLYFPMFVDGLAPASNPVELVNRYALSTLAGLFALRFLFQKPPSLHVQPYLHLPIRRRHLVLFFQAASLLSVHNAYPLLFAVPFTFAHVLPIYGAAIAWTWLSGIFACLVFLNFANLYLRTLLSRKEGLLLALLAAGALVGFLDEYLGAGLIGTVSHGAFSGLVEGNPWTALSLVLAVLGMAVLAGSSLLLALRNREPDVVPDRRPGRLHELADRWGLSGQLIWLELRLMWRNQRPRHFVLVSMLFSTVYLLMMLAGRQVFGGVVFGAVIGLFASGGFALNYGQLMFAWDSPFFDGQLARDLQVRAIARTKVMVLQGSCLVLFVVSLPLFLWLRPDLVPLHVAFLFYNAGVTTVLIMELAIRNRQRIELDQTGSFFNYEGFSVRHWLWFFPTVIPPTVVLFWLRDSPQLAWTILALIGLVGMALSELWTRRFAVVIHRNRHITAAGFRDKG